MATRRVAPVPFVASLLLSCAFAGIPARADLHVRDVADAHEALVLRTKARELFVARPGAALVRAGRLPEGASPLGTDGLRVASVARDGGDLRACELRVDAQTTWFGCHEARIPREADASALNDLVVPDVSAIFLGGGWRWDRTSRSLLPGHLPEHPDLEVIASRNVGELVVRLCRDAADPEAPGAPRRLWLVTGDGVRALAGEAGDGDRLELDASAAHVRHADGRIVAWSMPSLAAHEDLSAMLPGGRLLAFSIDGDSYWLETEQDDGVAHWRVDRETLDFERVSLSGVPRGYRAVGDTGADLWFARPGTTEDVVLMSVPKTGAGAQGYGAPSRGERRARGFFRGVARVFVFAGAIVATPVLLPIALIRDGMED